MFASKIKQIMKERKVTIRDVTGSTGISSSTMAKARDNAGIAECRLSTLGRIANALDVSVKDLFDGEYESLPKG